MIVSKETKMIVSKETMELEGKLIKVFEDFCKAIKKDCIRKGKTLLYINRDLYKAIQAVDKNIDTILENTDVEQIIQKS